MPEYVDRPTAAFVLSLIGGIFVLLGGIVLTALLAIVGGVATLPLGGFGAALGFYGVLGIVWGIVIIIGAVMMHSHPENHTMWGVIVLVFSILSWFGGAAGFFIGFLLGLIGGILGIAWKPRQMMAQATDTGFPPQQ